MYQWHSSWKKHNINPSNTIINVHWLTAVLWYFMSIKKCILMNQRFHIHLIITGAVELPVAFEIGKAKHENTTAVERNCRQNHTTIFCLSVQDIKLRSIAPSYGTLTNATETFAFVIALPSRTYLSSKCPYILPCFDGCCEHWLSDSCLEPMHAGKFVKFPLHLELTLSGEV